VTGKYLTDWSVEWSKKFLKSFLLWVNSGLLMNFDLCIKMTDFRTVD
jgi:hypothetical protein